ncbi:MAG TPA: Gfo/Idh/MocA family oxidoreductase [Chthoniobacterales bacterium]
MKTPLRLIQIGCGGWGWSWIGVVQRSKLWNLAAVVDVNAGTLERVRATYGIGPGETFASLDDALKEVQADAALVVVPPEAHAPVAEQALSRGLHCLIEKPLAASVADARGIVSAGRAAEKKVMVSQNYRFKRAPQTVKKVLQDNVIGEVGSVFVNFQKAPRFADYRLKMAEPLLTDFAIHHFDQMRGIIGLEPIQVTARSWNPKWSIFAGNATASVILEMSNNATVVYNASWASQGWETTWDGDWRIQGDGGEIHWSNNGITLRPSDLFKTVFMEGAVEQNGTLQVGLVPMELEERQAVLAEFQASIVENREPQTNATDNLRSIAMVLAALASARSGQPVRIEDILAGAK